MSDKDSDLELALTAARAEAKQWENEALDLMEQNKELSMVIEEYERQIKELLRRQAGRDTAIKMGTQAYPSSPNDWCFDKG